MDEVVRALESSILVYTPKIKLSRRLIISGLPYRRSWQENLKNFCTASCIRRFVGVQDFTLDLGLLRRLSGLAPSAIAEGNRLLVEFKGALTENYILYSLVQQFESVPRYWSYENRAEVDFLVQQENDIIPIEVKSHENVTGKSLAFYRKEFSPDLSIRYSLKNLNKTVISHKTVCSSYLNSWQNEYDQKRRIDFVCGK